jgi:hypothetical protein
MKKLLLILLCLPFIGFGQNVNITDANFKAYLVGNIAINTNGDTEIQVSEASSFGGTIDCSNMNISDLTGIEYFSLLSNLNCGNNQLTNLDVSQNINLMDFECSFNQITSLNLSNNTALINLYLDDNLLTSLDLRNGDNSSIDQFYVSYNPNLTCINVDDVAWSTSNWLLIDEQIDAQHYFSNNCPPSSVQEYFSNKELLKVTDLLGRETKQTNQPFFYIYDDGTVEKRIVIE